MVQETEYHFDDDVTQSKAKDSALSGLGKFLWNSETKEFLGRDGASWGKVSLFYAVFYACLGSFFIGMLAVFMAQMPTDKPTYYGTSSTMNARGINPGIGFRPQVDVEDALIFYNPLSYESITAHGYKPLVNNLRNFLESKYKDYTDAENNHLLSCADGSTYNSDLQGGLSCRFDYKTIFKSTPCTLENNYGFQTNQACILLKLNKIISWTPELAANTTSIEIKCTGETSADKDNLKGVIYHSDGKLNDKTGGYIDAKYFPFYAQSTYRAPFIFAQFDIPANTLVNIECKAFAKNIDNADRLNRRGMTKFSLLVSNTK